VTEVDPITVEVVRNAFITLIQEMRASIGRAAFSPIIYESHDFSCALLNARGEIVAISDDLPAHILPTALGVTAAQEKFGEDIHPGDVVMMNDPYVLGSHMNDTATLHPYFLGDRLMAWVAVRVHYLDVGGMTPGSIAIQATDVHQEGTRIPPIKLYERGEPNRAAMDLLLANVRQHREFEGDLMAVVGAANLAHTRLAETYGKYGPEVVERCSELILDRGERRMREAISRARPGEYCHETYMESPQDGAPLLIRVRLSIGGGNVVVDFSESAPQTSGAINGGLASARSGAFVAIKAALDPYSPVNAGAFRPITVITKPGSMLQAEYPAACCGAMNVINATTEAVMKNLASPYAEGVIAGAVPIYAMLVLAGWDDQRGRSFIHFESNIGGTGAVKEHDGNNVVAGYERSDFPRIFPAEVAETQYPLRLETTELVPNSGGPGQRRGGLGMRRVIRIMCDNAVLTTNLEPSVYPSTGLFGGASAGTVYEVNVTRNGRRLDLRSVNGKTVGFPLERGDVVEQITTTGAGYGDPLTREVEMVLSDLSNGYITEDHARSAYGVVVRDGSVDLEATDLLRADLAGRRRYLRGRDDEAEDFASGRRIARMRKGLADDLDLRQGDVVELVTPDAAALRAWVSIDDQAPAGSVPMGPSDGRARSDGPEEMVWVRPLAGAPPEVPAE
jgi:N-methylhydantoinase B